MAARKYSGVRKKHGGGKITPIGTVLNAYALERVTAYDARDVDPLTEAARKSLGELEDIHAPSAGRLRAALAPFDSEE